MRSPYRALSLLPGASLEDVRWVAGICGVDGWALPQVTPWSGQAVEDRSPTKDEDLSLLAGEAWQAVAARTAFLTAAFGPASDMSPRQRVRPGQSWWARRPTGRPAVRSRAGEWDRLRPIAVEHGLTASAGLADPRAFWVWVNAQMTDLLS